MRFHARQSVGDRLLLRFLEREGVVQRAGKKIGERAQQQNILLGKIARFGGFDVEDAKKLLAVCDRQSHGCDRRW